MVIRLSTGLKSIDAGRNPSLLQLNCRGCDDAKLYPPAALDKLSVKGCRNLEFLDASWNNIKSIDLSGNKKLVSLNLKKCKFKKIDISNNKKLRSLDISGNKKLKGIDIKCCPALGNLYLSGMNFTEIDVSKNTELKFFKFNRAKFTSIDLSKDKKLEYVSCRNGRLKDNGLVIGKNSNISIISCSGNKLTKIDTGKCINLKNLGYLHCRNNMLKRLDITKNRRLYELHCENNKIKKLDIRNCVIRLSYGDEFFTYDDSVVLVRKHKNKK